MRKNFEEIMFISSENVVQKGNMYKLELGLFNVKNDKNTFSSSLMTKSKLEKYEQNILDMLGQNSWIEVIYGVTPPEFEPIFDSENEDIIAGLSTKKGLILKNEVKPLVQEEEFIQ